MTMTPHLISEFLTPWVIAAVAYPFVFVALRRVAGMAPRVVASLGTASLPGARLARWRNVWSLEEHRRRRHARETTSGQMYPVGLYVFPDGHGELRVVLPDNSRPASTARDMTTLVLMLVGATGLGLLIDDVIPATQWWSQPLTSGWAVSYGFAMVLVAFVVQILYLVAALLIVITGLVLLTWLAEPVSDEPDSPNLMQVIWGAVQGLWHRAFRRGRPAREAGRA